MRSKVIASLLLVVWGTGCITTAGKNLEAISPPPPAETQTVDQTVGDFEFTLEGGKMVTSNKAGRILNDEILKRWKKQGYIADFTYVANGAFTGNADYNLTLSGSQYGESSIVAQIFSGLTLLLIPYTVNTRYDIQYTLENVKTGDQYSASVEDSYRTIIELLLFLAAPFAGSGASETFDRMGDHLYEQLRTQGAFDAPNAAGSD